MLSRLAGAGQRLPLAVLNFFLFDAACNPRFHFCLREADEMIGRICTYTPMQGSLRFIR
jgi:hypothetical protein